MVNQGIKAELEELDLQLLISEWPAGIYKGVYLNSGSCGVKPRSVLDAIQTGWNKLNENPTLATFLDKEVWETTKSAASRLCNVPSDQLIFIPNSTFGIQLVMQSFLQNPGDQIVTSTQEHRCVNTLGRYLEESRGITVRKHTMDSAAGSQAFCQGILNLINSKTRLVIVSQINCLTGWRPNLAQLCLELKDAKIPLLEDGAHAPGQGPLSLKEYPLWVASCHKWMGAPNGTGLLKAEPELMEKLKPLSIGDRYYDEDFDLAHRLEWHGTGDVVKLAGLRAAIDLQLKLGPVKIAHRQLELQSYLRKCLSELPAGTIRTPDADGERSALLAIHWNKNQLKVDDLRAELWQKHQIWVQPDYASETPGHGMRISCNVFNKEQEIDALISALKTLLL